MMEWIRIHKTNVRQQKAEKEIIIFKNYFKKKLAIFGRFKNVLRKVHPNKKIKQGLSWWCSGCNTVLPMQLMLSVEGF